MVSFGMHTDENGFAVLAQDEEMVIRVDFILKQIANGSLNAENHIVKRATFNLGNGGKDRLRRIRRAKERQGLTDGQRADWILVCASTGSRNITRIENVNILAVVSVVKDDGT